jgi:hypothetical protein
MYYYRYRHRRPYYCRRCYYPSYRRYYPYYYPFYNEYYPYGYQDDPENDNEDDDKDNGIRPYPHPQNVDVVEATVDELSPRQNVVNSDPNRQLNPTVY